MYVRGLISGNIIKKDKQTNKHVTGAALLIISGLIAITDRRLRWLDTVFQGQYLPSLSINYVAINKDCEKLPPQLYQIKMKICYD